MIQGLDVDWSLARLLDELWLRVRRLLIHQLAASHLWVDKAEYREFLERQRGLGMRLRDEWLPQALGENDYLCLNSERGFRAANSQVRAKMPLVLAFGYELAGSLAALCRCKSRRSEQAAVLCALFNFGISLFDIVVDQSPQLVGTLARHVNERTLRHLDADAAAVAELHRSWAQVEDDELRILLKIILAFFGHLRQLYSTAENACVDGGVLPHLERAYRAELSSAAASVNGAADAVQISKEKSALPFTIMGRIVGLGMDGARGLGAEPALALATAVGEIFWLTDDLTDIVADLRSGSVNGVLAGCGLAQGVSRDSAQLYDAVTDLLGGRELENRTSDVVSRLLALETQLRAGEFENSAVMPFRRLILFYVRCWIT